MRRLGIEPRTNGSKATAAPPNSLAVPSSPELIPSRPGARQRLESAPWSEVAPPARLPPERRPPRSLSFGHGAHKCIGEHLGRLEGRILLEEILALAPNYEVDSKGVERTYSEFLHGYHALPIEFAARTL